MDPATLIAAFILFAIGVGFLLAGYRLFRTLAPVWGFLIGFDLALTIERASFGLHPLAFTAGPSLTGLVIAVIVGLIFGALAYAYYYLSVVALGAIMGFTLGEAIAGAILPHENPTLVLAGLLAAIVAAALVIGMDLPKALIVLFTAIGGAYTIVLAGLLVSGHMSLATVEANPSIAPLGATGAAGVIALALAFAGILYQAWQLRRVPYDHIYYVRQRARRAAATPASAVSTRRQVPPPTTA